MPKKYILGLTDELKNIFVVLSTTLSVFLEPIGGLVFVAITLCLFDMLVAILASIKDHGLSAFSSTKTQTTFVKILLYSGLILALHILDVVFIQQQGKDLLSVFVEKPDIVHKIHLTSAALFLITFRELKSIDEKIERILGWSFYETTTHYFLNVLDKLKSALTLKSKL